MLNDKKHERANVKNRNFILLLKIDSIEIDVIWNEKFSEDLDGKFVYSIYAFRIIVRRGPLKGLLIANI